MRSLVVLLVERLVNHRTVRAGRRVRPRARSATIQAAAACAQTFCIYEEVKVSAAKNVEFS